MFFESSQFNFHSPMILEYYNHNDEANFNSEN